MIKVVLLCHYWSDEVTEMLKCDPHKEFATWIQETLNLFKNKKEIELHVVAPNYATNEDKYIFKDEIHYHFYNYSYKHISKIVIKILALLFSKYKNQYEFICHNLNTITAFIYPKYKITKILNILEPDLIHLYGSENPIYSVGVINILQKYPVLLTTQGYAYLQNNPSNLLGKIFHSQRISLEKQVNSKVKYLANFVKSVHFKPFENNQIFFYLYPPTKVPQIDASTITKEYDVVFYARVCREKGIEDLIDAIGLLHKRGIRLKTLVIGASIQEYLKYLKIKAGQLNIGDLLTFAGFIHDHEEVYKQAAKAKLLVLPSHNDGFNNTIREAMFMKLPVLANDVGTVSIANNNQECITLTKVGNTEDLTTKILLILNDEQRTQRLINNAYNEMTEKYSPQGIYQMTLDIYLKAFSHSNK